MRIQGLLTLTPVLEPLISRRMAQDAMSSFESSYQEAHSSGLLPGVALMAESREGTRSAAPGFTSSHFLTNDLGEFKYAKTIGVRSLKSGKPKPMERDTVLALASCTKLMTAISVLQCVERGLLALDQDVTPLLPEVGKFGIITGFDDVTGQPVTIPNTKHVTLR